jgi:UDP-glucose-4-epimerase GalE
VKILVTGGLGYIGSHTVRWLLQRGDEVSVLDDGSTGHRASLGEIEVHEADLCRSDLSEILSRSGCRAVIHFAGKALIPESVRDPALYYETNTFGGFRLLEAMRQVGVRRLVFSSTCATYGLPGKNPITEDTPQLPVTAYGSSKLAFEHVLRDYCQAYGFGAIALRYFNAAGAEADGGHGEDHTTETHLIPLLLKAALGGGTFRMFGTDYPTPDGTCVRDFIHVNDLAEAHGLAIDSVEEGRFEAVNLGTGVGNSVREVVELASRLTGRTIDIREDARRPGDPPFLVASVERARERLGFRSKHTLEEILASAWRWHQNHPHGYGD